MERVCQGQQQLHFQTYQRLIIHNSLDILLKTNYHNQTSQKEHFMLTYLILFAAYITSMIILMYGQVWPSLIIFLSGYVVAGGIALARHIKGRNVNKN